MPRPIITLLTDFGTRDGYVAAMKGVILTAAPDVTIVDAAHDLAPQDVRSAAWVLQQYAHLYPEGTIHVAVVDPGVGTDRRVLCARADGHIFLAPDNGLLWWVLRRASQRTTAALKPEVHRAGVPSATFHGRDILAHAAGVLAQGARVEAIADPFEPEARPPWGAVAAVGSEIHGEVLHVDRFGNLVTNITGEDLATRNPTGIRISVAGRTITSLSRTYGQVPRGELAAYVGSSGMLEIAVNMGSAEKELEAVASDSVIVTWETEL